MNYILLWIRAPFNTASQWNTVRQIMNKLNLFLFSDNRITMLYKEIVCMCVRAPNKIDLLGLFLF